MKVPVEKTTAEPSIDLPTGGQEDPMAGGEAPMGDAPDAPEAPQSEKPFDDEPFDAGVQADEESDPKHFIQQLSGKLGQSIRTYTDSQGQPDFELEKFAINSIISATHTSEMEPNDQEDIISKIKSSGQGDSNDMSEPEGNDNEEMSMDEPMDEPMDASEEPTEESFMRENLSKDKKFSIFVENLIKDKMKKQRHLNETIDEILMNPSITSDVETEEPVVKDPEIETEKPSRVDPNKSPQYDPWKTPIIKEDPAPKASR